MPFNYRDKSHLADRLRGKSGEEILNELKSDLDTQGRRMFFDSPSWRTRQSNSAFPRGFPFDDDRNRIDIRTYLDEIANRHPEFASQLKERPWGGEEFVDPSFAGGQGSGGEFVPRKNAESEASGSKEEENKEREPVQNLTNFGLRNTVPLGPQAYKEQDRHQRSMSAPPDNSGATKRFVTKCEIPVMSNPMQESVQIKPDLAGKGPQDPNVQKPNNAPNVRVIPIQVEGRDTPLVNTNIDTSANFGSEVFTEPFEGRLPRDFGSYQRHSPRFTHKERAPTPPQYQYAPQFQQYAPSSQHYMPQQPQGFAHQQQFPPRPQAPTPPHFQQHQYPPQPQQQQHYQQQKQQQQPQHQQRQQQQPQHQQRQHQQQQQQQHQHQQQQQHGFKLPQGDETDSRAPPPPPPKSEPVKDPIDKVQAIQKEVDELMREVEAFKGTSRTDKQYLMLDELLTRQLLLLDNIDTEGKDNVRQARKDTIRSIQRCISTLENKVPVLEGTDSKTDSVAGEDEAKKAVDAGASQPMEVDKSKENTPVGNKDSQKMEVDEAVGGSQSQTEQQQNPSQQQEQQQSSQTKEENKEKI